MWPKAIVNLILFAAVGIHVHTGDASSSQPKASTDNKYLVKVYQDTQVQVDVRFAIVEDKSATTARAILTNLQDQRSQLMNFRIILLDAKLDEVALSNWTAVPPLVPGKTFTLDVPLTGDMVSRVKGCRWEVSRNYFLE